MNRDNLRNIHRTRKYAIKVLAFSHEEVMQIYLNIESYQTYNKLLRRV